MEVVNSTDLHKRPGKYSEKIRKDNMLFVANEHTYKNSFVCVNPVFMAELLRLSGFPETASTVVEIFRGTKQRVSERYTRLVAKRTK